MVPRRPTRSDQIPVGTSKIAEASMVIPKIEAPRA